MSFITILAYLLPSSMHHTSHTCLVFVSALINYRVFNMFKWGQDNILLSICILKYSPAVLLSVGLLRHPWMRHNPSINRFLLEIIIVSIGGDQILWKTKLKVRGHFFKQAFYIWVKGMSLSYYREIRLVRNVYIMRLTWECLYKLFHCKINLIFFPGISLNQVLGFLPLLTTSHPPPASHRYKYCL